MQRFEVIDQRLSTRNCRFSTHGISIADVVELGRALNRLPAQLVIIGIEGKNFSCGTSLSPEVERVGELAVEVILSELATDDELPQRGEQFSQTRPHR